MYCELYGFFYVDLKGIDADLSSSRRVLSRRRFLSCGGKRVYLPLLSTELDAATDRSYLFYVGTTYLPYELPTVRVCSRIYSYTSAKEDAPHAYPGLPYRTCNT